MTSVFVIAEVGVNHDGRTERAQELIKAAATIGANAVKFQTFAVEKLVHRSAAKPKYQVGHSKGTTQFHMLKDLELSRSSHHALSEMALDLGIEFMSTPFDIDSLNFLADEIKVRRLKISSGDLTNLPLLHAAGQTGLPLILSTGMADLDEVTLGLGAVAHGRGLHEGRQMPPPCPRAFYDVLTTDDASRLTYDVSLLQCTSEYPAPDENTNLLAMQTLAERFQLPVGLSDHSRGNHLSVAAVALGASIVEKHLTANTAADGPDHRSSLDANDFRSMINSIRSVERALGSGRKYPSEQEVANAKLVRRGLYAARDLKPGDVVSASDIDILRPENGTHPAAYWDILGSIVTHNLKRGDPFKQ